MIESVAAHPNFQATATWTMNILASGQEEITADIGQTIGAMSSPPVTSLILSSQLVGYIPVASYTSDVNFQTQDQAISALEKNTALITPNLSCSTSGSTLISTPAIVRGIGYSYPIWS